MPNDRLVGGQGTLDQLQQVRTIGSFWPYASTVFDYIRRAMPFQSPQSLTNDEVYALTAYLLAENGIIERGATLNAQTLAPRADAQSRRFHPRVSAAQRLMSRARSSAARAS